LEEVKKKQYFFLIRFVLRQLKNPESFKKIFVYSQDLLMNEMEQKEVTD
jgi:hypothetical protein